MYKLSVILLASFGLAVAYPFPQQYNQQQQQQQQQVQQQQPQFTQNGYLPQITSLLNQGQSQGGFVPSENTAHFAGTNGEISNLTPPSLQGQSQSSSQISGELVRAANNPQQEQQDSYANFRQFQQPQNQGLASALVNGNQNGGSPHEYGEIVPGEFSSLNSYAAYQNYQSNSN